MHTYLQYFYLLLEFVTGQWPNTIQNLFTLENHIDIIILLIVTGDVVLVGEEDGVASNDVDVLGMDCTYLYLFNMPISQGCCS